MKTLTRFLLGMVVLALFGCIGVMLFATPAHGQTGADILPGGPPGSAIAPPQVTDAPIVRIAPLDRMLVDVDLRAGRHCATWWERDADRYGDYHRVKAALDVPLLAASAVQALQAALKARDLPTLTASRTHNVSELQAALRPCVPDWEPKTDPVLEAVRQRELDEFAKARPTPAWVVPASTAADGMKPAFCLQADGTRSTKACDRVPATIPGTTVASWCDCTVRSKEPAGSSSTYCRPATEPRTFDPAEPVRVTLCRESK